MSDSNMVGHNKPKDVILYPAGGAFNKLRNHQIFMECLIDEACDEYTELAAGEKREFVRTQICQRIRNTGRALLVFRGTHPTKGILEEAPEDEILDRLAQKLRDLKKRRLRGDAPTYKRRKLERPSMPESHSDVVNAGPWDRPRDPKLSVKELKEIIWGQWEQIDSWRRLCSSQSKTIGALRVVNSRQHDALLRSTTDDYSSSANVPICSDSVETEQTERHSRQPDALLQSTTDDYRRSANVPICSDSVETEQTERHEPVRCVTEESKIPAPFEYDEAEVLYPCFSV